MRPRFFVQGVLKEGTEVSIQGEEFHHAARVSRLTVGEEIEVIGEDATARALVRSIGPSAITASVEELLASREPALKIILAPALIQIEKFELVLQKGTELGVARFVPLLTGRTEVRPERVAGKQERWEKIIQEAVKQSGRSVVPVLERPVTLAEILARPGIKVILDADQASDEVAPAGELTLMIGPEGGWTPEEVSAAVRAGALTRRMGPRRLRAETAAIVAVAWFAARYGDLE